MTENTAIDCPWCGQWTRLEQINGHYACTSCHRPVIDCCDGEQVQEIKYNA